jgi:glutamate synthase domain-containing protein 2
MLAKMTTEWGTQRLINMLAAWRTQLVDILSRFGMRDVAELRGRTDLMYHEDYE